jgi:esterase/lipase superfamily enzyme
MLICGHFKHPLYEDAMDYIFTARNIKDGDFGTDPGPTRFLEIPANAKAHTPAMAISRPDWFRKVRDLAETARSPQGRPLGDVLIYIHGFNVDLGLILKRHRLLRDGLEALGYKGAVVSFDWPCANSALAYLEDRTDAKLTALRLVTDGIAPFCRMQAQDCAISTHVLAHSMGAFVLREALDDADDRPALVTTGWSLSQVMLCGADVSADSMGQSAVSASLYRHCIRLTNYSNPYDAVLSISGAKRVGVAPRVGRIGLPAGAPAKAVNVDVGIHYDENREAYANVANSDHSFHLSSAMFLKDVYLTLLGEIDRAAIPTRFADSAGRLHLQP